MNAGSFSQWQKDRNYLITKAVLECEAKGGRGEMERQALLHHISRQRIKEIVTITKEYVLDEYDAIDMGG